MSHASIIQVSLFPIEPTEFIDEDIILLHPWFLGEVADYVRDGKREEIIAELQQFSRGYQVGEDANNRHTITVTNKEAYFQPSWEHFCKKMKSRIDLETFMAFPDSDDRTGNWIYADGELMTFPRFVHRCLANEPYYIGGVVDFHT